VHYALAIYYWSSLSKFKSARPGEWKALMEIHLKLELLENRNGNEKRFGILEREMKNGIDKSNNSSIKLLT